MGEDAFTRLELTDSYGRKIVIEHAHTDLESSIFIENLIRPAMLACGFVEATVNEVLGEP